MKTKLLLSSIFVLSTFSSCKKEPPYQSIFGKNLRFDGYYLYDNHIDTFSVLPDGRRIYNEIKNFGIKTGLPLLRDINNDCTPKEVVFDGNKSPFLAYIAFFNDTAGILTTENCRAKHNVEFTTNFLLEEKHKYLKKGAILGTMFDKTTALTDSTATFTNRKSVPFLTEKYACKFMGDSIEITTWRSEFEDSKDEKNATRMYYFVPDKRFE